MLRKLPLAWCMIYMYNYCCSKSCSECKYFTNRYFHKTCKFKPFIAIKLYGDFCESKLDCSVCNLAEKYKCSAQTAVDKFIEFKKDYEKEII